jgi:hypothetical protein
MFLQNVGVCLQDCMLRTTISVDAAVKTTKLKSDLKTNIIRVVTLGSLEKI